MPRKCSHILMLYTSSQQSDVSFNKSITFLMVKMKPIAAELIIDAVQYIYTHSVFIRNGFPAAGIANAISEIS